MTMLGDGTTTTLTEATGTYTWAGAFEAATVAGAVVLAALVF